MCVCHVSAWVGVFNLTHADTPFFSLFLFLFFASPHPIRAHPWTHYSEPCQTCCRVVFSQNGIRPTCICGSKLGSVECWRDGGWIKWRCLLILLLLLLPPLYFSSCLNDGGGAWSFSLSCRGVRTRWTLCAKRGCRDMDGRRESCGNLNRDKCFSSKKQRHQLFAKDCQVILCSAKLSDNTLNFWIKVLLKVCHICSFPAKNDKSQTSLGWPGRVLARHPFVFFLPTGVKEEILSLNSLQHLRVSAGLVNAQRNKLFQLWRAKAESHWSHKAPDVRMHYDDLEPGRVPLTTSTVSEFRDCALVVESFSMFHQFLSKKSLDINCKSWITLKRRRNHI